MALFHNSLCVHSVQDSPSNTFSEQPFKEKHRGRILRIKQDQRSRWSPKPVSIKPRADHQKERRTPPLRTLKTFITRIPVSDRPRTPRIAIRASGPLGTMGARCNVFGVRMAHVRLHSKCSILATVAVKKSSRQTQRRHIAHNS